MSHVYSEVGLSLGMRLPMHGLSLGIRVHSFNPEMRHFSLRMRLIPLHSLRMGLTSFSLGPRL